MHSFCLLTSTERISKPNQSLLYLHTWYEDFEKLIIEKRKESYSNKSLCVIVNQLSSKIWPAKLVIYFILYLELNSKFKKKSFAMKNKNILPKKEDWPASHDTTKLYQCRPQPTNDPLPFKIIHW